MRGSGESSIKSIRLVGVGFLLAGALIPAMLVGYTDAARNAPVDSRAGGPAGVGGIVAQERDGKTLIKVNGQPAPWTGPSARKKTSNSGNEPGPRPAPGSGTVMPPTKSEPDALAVPAPVPAPAPAPATAPV